MRENKKLVKNPSESSLKGPKITCSLLIPLDLIKKLPKSERKNIGKNIDFLLRRYGNRLKNHRAINRKALTIKYQKPGNSLIKVNSRILPEEWGMFSLLASSHGISRCFLYCILIQIFLSDRSNHSLKIRYNFRVPKIESFIWTIDLETKIIQRILYQGRLFSSS